MQQFFKHYESSLINNTLELSRFVFSLIKSLSLIRIESVIILIDEVIYKRSIKLELLMTLEFLEA